MGRSFLVSASMDFRDYTEGRRVIRRCATPQSYLWMALAFAYATMTRS